MSKQRQVTRAERQRVAAEKAAEVSAARAERDRRLAVERARRERRTLWWKRIRLWQHGPQFRRRREAWGVIAVVALLCLLLAYLLTRSVEVVVGTALVLIIASPVLVALAFDRSRS